MIKFLCTKLPCNKTKEYFLQTLAEGHTLARELLNSVNFGEGSFFAITAKSADLSSLEEFFYGGILPPNSLQTIQVIDKKYGVRKKSDSKKELTQFLYQEMIKNKQNCAVFEEVAFEKDDECLSIFKSEIKCFNKEVYYFTSSKDCTKKKLASFVQMADAQWYYMNIVTEKSIQGEEKLKITDLKELALKTKLLVLGAYDIEGYVCWEKHA